VYRKVKCRWRSIAVIRFMNYEGEYKERVQRRQSVYICEDDREKQLSVPQQNLKMKTLKH